MCCGFGGAMLLFLMVASSRTRLYPTDQILVARVASSEATVFGEIGIEYRRVGETEWQRAIDQPLTNTENAEIPIFFTAPMKDTSGSEAILIWRQPPTGSWQFRPYLADMPLRRAQQQEPIPLQLEIHTRGGTSLGPQEKLRFSGVPGQSVQVVIDEVKKT